MLAEKILKFSTLTELEIAAIKVGVTDYDRFGRPIHVCEKCPKTDNFKRMMGCGFDDRYRGKSEITKKAGLYGICPGWYRSTLFFYDAMKYIRLKERYSLDFLSNRRLVEVFYWSDIWEAESRSKELESQAKNELKGG